MECSVNDIQCRGRIVKSMCIYHYQKAKYNTGIKRKFSKAEIYKIIELYNSGLNSQKVSELIGCSRAGISNIINKNGLTRNHKERDCQKGKKMPDSYSKYLSERMTGTKMPIRTRINMSNSQLKRFDGYIRKEPENKIIRKSFEYKLWRESVFERDNYTCVECGTRGGELNADHIKPFAYYHKLRFDINNGRTLCVACHRKTSTFGANALNYKLEVA